MQEMGLEPTHCCQRQILSLMRLPFRHSCICMSEQKRSRENYNTIIVVELQELFLPLFYPPFLSDSKIGYYYLAGFTLSEAYRNVCTMKLVIFLLCNLLA